MPSYNKEIAARIVLGAYNANKVLSEGMNRIAFLEDIECEEMYHYAGKIGCIAKEQCTFKWGGSQPISFQLTQLGKGYFVFSFSRCAFSSITD
jgi:hypothetical protein